MTTEQNVIDDFKTNLRKGDVFYDIGAFYGEYSFQASMNGASNIVAVELRPGIMEEFKKRLNEYSNSWVDTGNIDSIELIPVALSDENGTEKLTDEFDNRVCPGLSGPTESNQTTVEVETAIGDDIIDRYDLPEPDVVKIDVEGAEMRVLEGMKRTLSSGDCRSIYLEIHPAGSGKTDLGTFGDDKESLFDLLKEYGYEPSAEFNKEEDRINMRWGQ